MKNTEPNKKKNKAKIIITILVILTIAIIWGHSVMPPDASSEESDFIKVIVEEIVQTVSGDSTFAIPEIVIRKSAHFIEYAVLGFELSLLYVIYGIDTYKKSHNDCIASNDNYCDKNNVKHIKRKIFVSKSRYIILYALLVAMIDESIQYFSGRYSYLFDVWLDLAGALMAMLIFFIVLSIKKQIQFKY